MTDKPIIGVDLGATNVSVGKIISGQITQHSTSNISSGGSAKQVNNEIIQAITKVFEPDVVGIGVGVPGLVDVTKGIVYDVLNIPSWKKVHLKDLLQSHFQRPVFINNDANCFAVGEKYFGKGKPYRNLVGVTMGSGLGTGIIINDHLYAGANCGAGEFGTMPYKDHICEYYCSGQFFKKVYGVNGEDLLEKAKNGDEEALQIFKQFGAHLGDAIMTILFALDPEAIILGGSVCQSFTFFQEAMWQKVKTFPYQHTLDHIVIEASSQPFIAVLGAAALYLDAQPNDL